MEEIIIKSGNCFKLIPYKTLYMMITDEHNGNVVYHIINLELGIVTCTFDTLGRVKDFLKKWKAIPSDKPLF